MEPRARPQGGVALGTGPIQPRARVHGRLPGGCRAASLRSGTVARVRALPGLVLLELPHRDDARLVLPRLRGSWLVAAALSVSRGAVRTAPVEQELRLARERQLERAVVQRLEPRMQADREQRRAGQFSLQRLEDL